MTQSSALISFLYGRQSASCCSRGQDRVPAFSELKKKKDEETVCIKKCYKKEYKMIEYLKETLTFDRQSGNRTVQARCVDKNEQTEIVGAGQ